MMSWESQGPAVQSQQLQWGSWTMGLNLQPRSQTGQAVRCLSGVATPQEAKGKREYFTKSCHYNGFVREIHRRELKEAPFGRRARIKSLLG